MRLSNSLFCLLLLFSHLNFLSAQNSPRISVQGILKDAEGAAIPNGTQSITFKLFPSATGGTAVWEEEANVSVKGGLYSHMLGSNSPLNAGIFSQPMFVGVIIDGFELLPRSELSYAPYTLYVERAGNGCPPGSIMPFAGANPPAGWLLCNGQALSSAQYPELFSVLSTQWGNGSSGSGAGAGTNFNVPDLRGEFLRGLDNGRGLDPGRTLGNVQSGATKLPATPFTGTTNNTGGHTHQLKRKGTADSSHTHGDTPTDYVAAVPSDNYNVSDVVMGSAGSHAHTVDIGGGGDSETRPRNVSVNYIIKY
ncbi:MAG: hypothetical protein RI973_1016 [Bacteroidota bacterium]|jgi:microcystin-dependent protein